jgi:hypothetical protein
MPQLKHFSYALLLVTLQLVLPAQTQATQTQASRVEQVGGIWVVELYGTREEMARRHGELVRDRLSETAVPYFASKIRKSIANTYIIRDVPFLSLPFQAAIDLVAQEPLRLSIPNDDASMLSAFAQGAGMKVRDIQNAWTLPDAGQWLTAVLFGKNQIQKGFAGMLPILPDWGCSSLVTSAALSNDGLLHARNLDYEGYGVFDRHTTLIRYHPSEPGAQQYISLGSLGLHQAGITAMNESGIILTLHQAMVAQTSLTGTPILSANERVIREARTLDDAVRILSSMKHAGSWRIILSSAREDRSLLLEVSALGTFVVEDSRYPRATAPIGLLLATNHVLAPELQKEEFTVNARYAEDTRLRLRALQNISRRTLAGGNRFNLQAAIDLISSQEAFDEGGPSHTPTSHGIIAKLNNIQSAVFEPAGNRLWIAQAPTDQPFAKPLQGSYISLPLFRSSAAPVPVQTRFPTALPTRERVRAHAFYRQAASLATEESRFEEAAEFYRLASLEEPAEALHPLMEGLSRFQAAQFEASRDALERAMALNPDRYHRSLLHLFLGRISDIEKVRELALAHYAQVELGLSDGLTEEVLRQSRKPYHFKNARKIVLDAVQADVLRW